MVSLAKWKDAIAIAVDEGLQWQGSLLAAGSGDDAVMTAFFIAIEMKEKCFWRVNLSDHPAIGQKLMFC